MADRAVRVEVAVAWPELQIIVELAVPEGTTALEAIERSGLPERFPSLEIQPDRIGIFSRPCRPDQAVRDGDRVEIYRPLRVDPKVARRKAASGSRQ